MSKKTRATKSDEPSLEPDRSSDSEYWQALGEFIEAFTRAENQLFLYLIHFIKVDKMIGKALLERDKCDALLAKLRHVWEVRTPELEKHEELEEAIHHLAAINTERNFIVHNISHVYPDKGRVTTHALRARTQATRAERQVSPRRLKDMTADLVRIKEHFLSSWYHPDDSLAKRVRFYSALGCAWQYKRGPVSGRSSSRGG